MVFIKGTLLGMKEFRKKVIILIQFFNYTMYNCTFHTNMFLELNDFPQ